MTEENKTPEVGQTDTTKTQVQVNLDIIRKTKVMIAIPCYGGNITESTFTSVIKWANTAKQYGIEWTVETLVNESLISRGRNTLTAKFLMSDCTHLFFWDADVGAEPWHLLVLLNRDVDVIGGLYPMKTMPVRWVVNGFEGAESTEDGLQEVSKTGTGFLLIKREVFEKLKDHPSVKPYKNDLGLAPEYDKHLCTFFDTAVSEGRYLSEDWQFCKLWKEIGGKVYVDKRVLLKHTGTYVFCQENENVLINAYGPKYVDLMKEKALKEYEEKQKESGEKPE